VNVKLTPQPLSQNIITVHVVFVLEFIVSYCTYHFIA